MIRSIVAIDEKNGMADENGIPWIGKIPSDQKYFVDQTETGTILMGYGTYLEFDKPFHDRINYVATRRPEKLREGFTKIKDVDKFLAETKDDIWNIGGPGLLASTLDQVDELYITQLEADFDCTKFLPDFKDDFILKSKSKTRIENGISFTFQVWKNKKSSV